MKYTELLSIPIRVLGVYIFYSAFLAVIRHYFALGQVAETNPDAYKTYAVTAILEVSIMVITAFLLVKLPLTISKLLSPAKTESTLSASITFEQLQSVALCILGMYILTKTIPEFILNAAWIIHHFSQPEAYPGALTELIINELVTIVEILLGLFLCIKSDGIGILINRIRKAGIAAPSN
tara:strand:+ start:83 stop:622 length:540 start_codon:yes stop_codon:yes gene_type:complete